MSITTIGTAQIRASAVQRSDLNTSTVGSAVVAKIIGGTNVTLSSTGADSGTGDVTVSAQVPVSTNTGNLLTLGTDSLPFLGASAIPVVTYYGTDTTNTVTYAVTVGSSFTLSSGVIVSVTPSLSCGASPTLNVNSTGAKAIVNRANIALSANEIVANKTFGVIYDGTSWRVITPIFRVYTATNPGTVSVECAGYDSVTARITQSVTGTVAVTLAHLAPGVPVHFVAQNTFTSAITYTLAATDVTGTAFTTYWVWSSATTGVAVVNLGTAQSLSTNLLFMAVGKANGAFLWMK